MRINTALAELYESRRHSHFKGVHYVQHSAYNSLESKKVFNNNFNDNIDAYINNKHLEVFQVETSRSRSIAIDAIKRNVEAISEIRSNKKDFKSNKKDKVVVESKKKIIQHEHLKAKMATLFADINDDDIMDDEDESLVYERKFIKDRKERKQKLLTRNLVEITENKNTLELLNTSLSEIEIKRDNYNFEDVPCGDDHTLASDHEIKKEMVEVCSGSVDVLTVPEIQTIFSEKELKEVKDSLVQVKDKSKEESIKEIVAVEIGGNCILLDDNKVDQIYADANENIVHNLHNRSDNIILDESSMIVEDLGSSLHRVKTSDLDSFVDEKRKDDIRKSDGLKVIAETVVGVRVLGETFVVLESQERSFKDVQDCISESSYESCFVPVGCEKFNNLYFKKEKIPLKFKDFDRVVFKKIFLGKALIVFRHVLKRIFDSQVVFSLLSGANNWIMGPFGNLMKYLCRYKSNTYREFDFFLSFMFINYYVKNGGIVVYDDFFSMFSESDSDRFTSVFVCRFLKLLSRIMVDYLLQYDRGKGMVARFIDREDFFREVDMGIFRDCHGSLLHYAKIKDAYRFYDGCLTRRILLWVENYEGSGGLSLIKHSFITVRGFFVLLVFDDFEYDVSATRDPERLFNSKVVLLRLGSGESYKMDQKLETFTYRCVRLGFGSENQGAFFRSYCGQFLYLNLDNRNILPDYLYGKTSFIKFGKYDVCNEATAEWVSKYLL